MTADDRRSSRFEAELGRAARSLAVESLPRAILSAPDPVGGSALPRLISAALIGAVAVVAVALWLGGQLPPSGAAPAPFRPAAAIDFELRGSGYACSAGLEPSPAPGATVSPDARPQVVCLTPANLQPVVGAIILGLGEDGDVATVHAKSGISGAGSAAAESSRAVLLERLVGIALARDVDAIAVRAWLREHLPIERGGRAEAVVRGFAIAVARDAQGGYELDVSIPGDRP